MNALHDALRGLTDGALERALFKSRAAGLEALERVPVDGAEAAWWTGLHELLAGERDRRMIVPSTCKRMGTRLMSGTTT